MNGFWYRQPGDLNQGRRQVNVLDELAYLSARFNNSRPAHEEWRLEAFFVHPAFFGPAVFACKKSLIGTVDDQRIFRQTGFIEEGKDASDLIIESINASDIVLDETLVDVKLGLFAFQLSFILHFSEL